MALIPLFPLGIDALAPAEPSNNSSPSQRVFFSFLFLQGFFIHLSLVALVGAGQRCSSSPASYAERGLLFVVDRARVLGAGFRGCGARASSLRGMWRLPRPGTDESAIQADS